jgi:hypothetical protein
MTVSRPGDRGVVYALRKVGAPKDRMLASSQSGRPAGKCHRKQTADGSYSFGTKSTGEGETVR